MENLKMGNILKAALIAGLAAGMAVSVFHLIFTEPLIDLAIAYEESLSRVPHGAIEEVVPRGIQKSLGLVTGFLAYGVFLSVIYAVAFMLSHRLLPANGVKSKAAILAGMAYWDLALFPFLKYPANPPTVGDPDNIAYRQWLFLAAMALAFLGTFLAYGVSRFLHHAFKMGPIPRRSLAMGLYAVYAVAIFLALPPQHLFIPIPLELVLNFRMLSIIGLTILWAVIGGIFSLIAGRWQDAVPAAG